MMSSETTAHDAGPTDILLPGADASVTLEEQPGVDESQDLSTIRQGLLDDEHNKRIRFIGNIIPVVALATLATLVMPWWNFTMPDGQTLAIPTTGGGLAETVLNGSTSVRTGMESGALPNALAVAALGAIAWFFLDRKQWLPTAAAAALIGPIGYGPPELAPDVQAGTISDEYTSPLLGLELFQIGYYTMMCLAFVAVLQVIMLRTAERKRSEAAGEAPTGLAAFISGMLQKRLGLQGIAPAEAEPNTDDSK